MHFRICRQAAFWRIVGLRMKLQVGEELINCSFMSGQNHGAGVSSQIIQTKIETIYFPIYPTQFTMLCWPSFVSFRGKLVPLHCLDGQGQSAYSLTLRLRYSFPQWGHGGQIIWYACTWVFNKNIKRSVMIISGLSNSLNSLTCQVDTILF